MADGGYTCNECNFQVWIPIAELGISHVGLYDDARFPGRCIVVLNRHEESLHSLSSDEADQFFRDAMSVGRALSVELKAEKVNYAVLGNSEPHLHWHVIPRFSSQEQNPLRPPWEHPERASTLGDLAISHLADRIRTALDVASQDAEVTSTSR